MHEASLFLEETRLQSITGDPFSSEKSFGSPASWPLHNANFALKKTPKNKKRQKNFLPIKVLQDWLTQLALVIR